MNESMHWYALYTNSRAEKKVKERFEAEEIEHYLPLKKTIKVWSDRKKEIIEPIIRGYIFVRTHEKQFKTIYETNGVVGFIRHLGKPIAIPDYQIENMRELIEKSDQEIEFSSENIEPGTSIKITQGPLLGYMGEMIEQKGKYKVVVRLDQLGCAMTTIPLSFVEVINNL